jgi:DNA-binding CsgD family transcriptional regulator/GAF domain-containing protein
MAGQRDSELTSALDLVGRAYEAAADAEQWPQFLDALAAATDCEGTLVWLHDPADNSARFRDAGASFVSNVRIAPEFARSYVEHYTYTNVLLKDLETLSEGTVMNSSSVIQPSEFEKTEYYNGWLRPQGVGYLAGGPVLKRNGTVAMLSLSRLEQRGPFTDTHLRMIGLLMPHLRRACLLHQRLTRLRAEGTGALAALDLLPHAVWLLDGHGRLLVSNRAGRELDRRRDGLWIGRDGRPMAADPRERLALQQLIAAAIAAGQGRSTVSDGAMRVRGPGHAEPLHVMLYPLRGDALVPGSSLAMFVFDPSRSPPPDAELLRTFYGLTPAEARLACALAQGASVDDYGASQQLSVNTVRTHLKHALEKTGVHRQSQLVALVAQLPAARGL